jgi:antitoxin VapB
MVYIYEELILVELAKLFQNGRSQAVRLPKAFRFKGQQVYIKKVGNAVVLLPFAEPWDSLDASLDKFSPDFMETRNQPEPQARDDLFK